MKRKICPYRGYWLAKIKMLLNKYACSHNNIKNEFKMQVWIKLKWEWNICKIISNLQVISV